MQSTTDFFVNLLLKKLLNLDQRTVINLYHIPQSQESKIDASSNDGLKPAIEKGEVEFSHVDFVYPTRESVQVRYLPISLHYISNGHLHEKIFNNMNIPQTLTNFSLKIPSGKRVALVGESGCGKSTIVKLVERFYDPVRGAVYVDGHDIKDINVSHLRSFIGIVNQEPILFSTTIAENIAYGREGVTQREIEEAAKMANAHDFITKFPQVI